MRPIIFRGKDEDGRWVYGDLLTNRRPIIEILAYNGTYTVDPETVGQFTGLYDKNGKEIYEGDIIRVNEFKNLLMNEFSEVDNRFDLFTIEEIKGQKQAEYVSQVRWEEGCFSISTNGEYFDMSIASLFGDMKRSQPMFECEVIGNIHDQKEETK